MHATHPALLRRLHSFTGLFPLGAYLLFHAYEHFAVRVGRTQLLERLASTSHAGLEIAVLFVPMVVHAALGILLYKREPQQTAYASPRFRRLQLFTGIQSALFLLFHVATLWWARVASQRPAVAYAALLEHVGTLPGAALYVLAITSTCLHFAQGLSAVLLRSGVPDNAARLVRGSCGVLGFLLWATFIDELAAYATGAPLL